MDTNLGGVTVCISTAKLIKSTSGAIDMGGKKHKPCPKRHLEKGAGLVLPKTYQEEQDKLKANKSVQSKGGLDTFLGAPKSDVKK